MTTKSGKNPFNFEEPVRDLDFFFGRSNEVRQILDFLRSGQCVSVIGPGKIGKTSLLNHLSHPRVLEEHGLAKSEHLFVYVNCEELADKDRAQWFSYLETQLRQQVAQASGVIVGHIGSRDDLSKVCEDLKRRGMKVIVIMLDTFESLISNGQFDSDFFVNLRSLSTNSPIAFWTASEKSLGELERKYLDGDPHGDTSPFSNIFAPFWLETLSGEESRALLRRYFDLAGFALPADSLNAIADRIVERTSGHPYSIQWIGWHTVNIWHTNSYRWGAASEKKFLRCLRNLPDV